MIIKKKIIGLVKKKSAKSEEQKNDCKIICITI